jgi:peptidoglycan/LPS O-acetylase OafA/YrhL
MKHSEKYVALDLLRGTAALMVCAGHIRNFLFVDFGEVGAPNFLDRIFYLATGLGHQAVIIFFVLSGFFVGGSVWKQLGRGEFAWREYALARLSRLWVVLLPALLATWCFDSLGQLLADHAGYDGRWHGLLSSGPGAGADGISLSAPTLLGNAFFLQTIAVPTFGTNGPLWSLANEFCYYLIFPFAAIALYKRAAPSLLGAAVMGGLLAGLPSGIQSGFIFWLMGWLAAVVAPKIARVTLWQQFLGVMVLGAALAGTKLLGGFAGELLAAAATMLLLLALPHVKLGGSPLARAAAKFSDMSYTLYLFHFPFVAFCWYVFVAPRQMQPSILGYGQFFIGLAATLLFCFVMWWFFERHTGRVRRYLRNALEVTR